jgi:hypothetical protein
MVEMARWWTDIHQVPPGAEDRQQIFSKKELRIAIL